MRLGNRYEAKSGKEQRLVFRCASASCGHVENVQVISEGRGGAANFLWLDGDGAAAKAEKRAETNATKIGAQLVTLTPCPVCRYMDPAARKTLRKQAWIHSLQGPAAALIIVIVLVKMKLNPALIVAITSVLALGIGGYLFASVWRRRQMVVTSVTFLGPRDADAALEVRSGKRLWA